MLGKVVGDIFDWLLEKILDTIFNPFIDQIQLLFFSEDAINNLPFVDSMYRNMRVAGLALLILITTWQAFKSMFAWMGFEVDEPHKIFFRAFAMGVLLLYSRDIIMIGIQYSSAFSSLILEAISGGSYQDNIKNAYQNINVTITTIFSLNAIFQIYIVIKSIGLFLRMFERVMLTGFLVIFSPLAFACGVAQSTKGFFVGFIKVLVGNLVTQVVQTACLSALGTLWVQNYLFGDVTFLNYFLTIALFKVAGKIEEVIREMSISAGIGKDMGGALRGLSTVIYSVNSVNTIGKSLGHMFAKKGG